MTIGNQQQMKISFAVVGHRSQQFRPQGTECVNHFINTDDTVDPRPLDYFCAAVAARWRANTVFAAGPYKTGNEQNAVIHALKEAVTLCRDYAIQNNQLVYSERPSAPTTLQEIRQSRPAQPRPFSYQDLIGTSYAV